MNDGMPNMDSRKGIPVNVVEGLDNLNLEDTKKLAQSIEKGIKYEFAKEFLVKPLPKRRSRNHLQYLLNLTHNKEKIRMESMLWITKLLKRQKKLILYIAKV